MRVLDTRDYIVEARRWAKFPASILFVTGFVWLLQSYFQFNTVQVGEQSEKGIGAVIAFINLVIVPLGSMVVALGLLLVLRWTYIPAALVPLYPLIATTVTLAAKVSRKFGEYRNLKLEGSFGDGVMTALLIIALWVLFGLVLLYLAKSWCLLKRSQEWLNKPSASNLPDLKDDAESGVDQSLDDEDEFCPLFPLSDTEPDTSD